jgi:hypothetical protein
MCPKLDRSCADQLEQLRRLSDIKLDNEGLKSSSEAISDALWQIWHSQREHSMVLQYSCPAPLSPSCASVTDGLKEGPIGIDSRLDSGSNLMILPNNLPFVMCDRCAHLMTLVRTNPNLKELSKLHVYICPTCGDFETKEVLSARPLQSAAPRSP